MKKRSTIVMVSMALLLSVAAACKVSDQNSLRSHNAAEECFGNGIDSIKVEVSTKIGGTRSLTLRDNAEAVVRFENKPDTLLSAAAAKELASLAASLFVEKTRKIVLSEEEASGRTDYPIFMVTLYNGSQPETTRYEMGTQEGDITHCTNCDIHYSPEFRDFTSQVFDILGR